MNMNFLKLLFLPMLVRCGLKTALYSPAETVRPEVPFHKNTRMPNKQKKEGNINDIHIN